jgi:hypothetical protein
MEDPEIEEEIKLNTLVCKVQRKDTDEETKGTHMTCEARGIDDYVDLGRDIFSIESSIPSASILSPSVGKGDLLYFKTEPVGREVQVRKVEHKGIPGGYDIEVEGV